MFFDVPTNGQSSNGASGRAADTPLDLTVLAEAERYWRRISTGGQPPRRSDVDPVQLGEALPATMILERVAPGMARVRLAGQTLNSLFGMDVRGMPVSILVAPACREALSAQIEAMFAGPAIVEIPLKIARSWGRRPVKARLLLLPLADDFGQVTRAMGVIASREELPAGGQQRFEIDGEGAFRCTLTAKSDVRRPERRRASTPVDPTRAKPMPRVVERPVEDVIRSIRQRPVAAIPRAAEGPPALQLITGGFRGERPAEEPRPALRLVVSNA